MIGIDFQTVSRRTYPRKGAAVATVQSANKRGACASRSHFRPPLPSPRHPLPRVIPRPCPLTPPLSPAAVTDGPRLRGFTQQEILPSQAQSPEVHHGCLGGVGQVLDAEGTVLGLPSPLSLGCWLIALDVPGCEEAPPHVHRDPMLSCLPWVSLSHHLSFTS